MNIYDLILMRAADMMPAEGCSTCKHVSEMFDSNVCDGCCKEHSKYEPENKYEVMA